MRSFPLGKGRIALLRVPFHPRSPSATLALMPKVSVLIPVYNGAPFLGDALESVLAQEGAPDFEIVTADDGSADATPALLERFVRRDARIRALRLPHGGIAKTLSAGLEACRAPYVCRLDADDLMPPGRLAAQTAFLETNPGVTAVSGMVVHEPHPEIPSDGMANYVAWMNRQKTHEEMLAAIWTDSPVAHPSVMFRRDAVLEAGGYASVPWPEDTDLWFRLLLRGRRFAKLDTGVLCWRDHGSRLTRTDNGHYGPAAQAAMKAHYLPRFFPRAARHGVTVIGAGPFGKRLAKSLAAGGVRVNRFVDVDPRKIGSSRLGIPVLSARDLRPDDGDLLVSAVGTPGARELIRSELAGLGIPASHGGDTRVVFCH